MGILKLSKKNGQNNEEFFSEIVKSYHERLYWHIRQMVLVHDDANDVLQNTFLKAWKNLDSFRGDSHISTWLYRIASNETLTFLAQKRKENIYSFDETEDILFNDMRADSYFDGDEAQLKLQKAILTLPEKQRLVFNMRFFEEMPYEEMSKIVDTSVGALKASYHHATKKVEEFLKKDD